MKYNVSRAIDKKIEHNKGLTEGALLNWISETLAKPNLQWVMIYEEEFDNELSIPKAHKIPWNVPT